MKIDIKAKIRLLQNKRDRQKYKQYRIEMGSVVGPLRCYLNSTGVARSHMLIDKVKERSNVGVDTRVVS
jgi:hypothetical protein